MRTAALGPGCPTELDPYDDMQTDKYKPFTAKGSR